jgi:Aspartyl protease
MSKLRGRAGGSESLHGSCLLVSAMRLLVCALFAALLPGSVQSKIVGEIPFRFHDGLIWLKVKIVGQDEPLNFLLDTGAGVSALDLQRARNLDLNLGQPQTVQGVNGECVGYRVNDLQASSAGVDLPRSVLAIDLGVLSSCCHQCVDGILGADFFRDRVVQIDFIAGKVRLLKDCDMDLANCEILPIKMCNDAFCVPLRVAGNRPEWIRLDTGCDAALEWVASGSGKKQVEPTSIGLSRSASQCVRTSVQIGKQHVAVPAVIHEKRIFPGEGGLLGNGLLAKFRLTIDAPGNRVIFEDRK